MPKFLTCQQLKLAFVVIRLVSKIAFIQSIDNPEEFPNLLAGSFTDGNSFSTGKFLNSNNFIWSSLHAFIIMYTRMHREYFTTCRLTFWFQSLGSSNN